MELAPAVVFPAQRQMLLGLVVARWACVLWMASQLFFAFRAQRGTVDTLDHPAIAITVFAGVVWLNLVFSIALKVDVGRLLRWRFAVLELVVAFSLYVMDGWVFLDGHVFGSQIALASSWPLVAVLSIAIVHGRRFGVIAGAVVPVGRIVAAAISGAGLNTGAHRMSFASSIVFYAVAGYVIGVIAEQLRDLANENAERRARDEVGRQLHDGVLQTLALVERRTAASDPELSRAASECDRDLRQWLWGQQPVGEPQDAVTCIRAATVAAGARCGVQVVFNAVGDADDIAGVPGEVARAFAAAAGELITNVGKHAGVVEAVVFVDVETGQLSVSVRDQGIGMDPDADEGDGLCRSVRERVAQVAGTVTVTSMPGEGTEVQLSWAT